MTLILCHNCGHDIDLHVLKLDNSCRVNACTCETPPSEIAVKYAARVGGWETAVNPDRALTPREFEALTKLIEYVAPGEEAHCDEQFTSGMDVTTHIFREIMVLQYYIYPE